MAQDILIVDDDRISLANFGNEIRRNLRIEPFLTDDPQNALNILRDYPIKVLITDQLMPSMTGLELVRRVRDDLKSDIPCIMLTGMTGNLNNADVVRLHLFDFINKMGNHDELIRTVSRAIERYNSEVMFKTNIRTDMILFDKKSLLKFSPRVTYKLIGIGSINKSYTKEEEWHTEYIAQKGTKRTEKVKINHRSKFTFEYSMQMDSTSKVGFKIGQLLSSVKSALENKISLTGKVVYDNEVTIEAEQTIEIMEIDNTPTADDLVLESREYQSAPVYTRANCLLEVTCNCCQIPKNLNVFVNLLTDRIALRYVEHFDKGPEQIIYTGIIQGTYQNIASI